MGNKAGRPAGRAPTPPGAALVLRRSSGPGANDRGGVGPMGNKAVRPAGTVTTCPPIWIGSGRRYGSNGGWASAVEWNFRPWLPTDVEPALEGSEGRGARACGRGG